jgi:hypothetical protein
LGLGRVTTGRRRDGLEQDSAVTGSRVPSRELLAPGEATQSTARSYPDARQIISALCNYLLLPSLAIVLIMGLRSMAVHPPFQDKRWAWVKAFLGLSMFEATLGIIQSKANYAAAISAKIAAGESTADGLANAIGNEWYALGAIIVLSIANIVLGVWRPRLAKP